MKLQKKETTRYMSIEPVPKLQGGLKKEEQGSEQHHRQPGDRLDANPSGSVSARCWSWTTISGGRRVAWGVRGRRTHGLSAESVEGVGSASGSVDGKYHSAGTVVTLSTVNPNCLGIIHGNGEGGEVGNAITNGFAGREGQIDASTPSQRWILTTQS